MKRLLIASFILTGCSKPVDPPLYPSDAHTCAVTETNHVLDARIVDGTVMCVESLDLLHSQCLLLTGKNGEWEIAREITCPAEATLSRR